MRPRIVRPANGPLLGLNLTLSIVIRTLLAPRLDFMLSDQNG